MRAPPSTLTGSPDACSSARASERAACLRAPARRQQCGRDAAAPRRRRTAPTTTPRRATAHDGRSGSRTRRCSASSHSRAICTATTGAATCSRPRSYSSRQAARRILPLEVLSTACASASTMSSAGTPSSVDRQLGDAIAQRGPPRGIGFARLGEHDDALGRAGRIGGGEHRDAASPHAGQVRPPPLPARTDGCCGRRG